MPFEKGVSGNPNGRPKGIIDKRSKLRGLLQERAPELINKVIERALEGDMAALRICVDRCLPPLKSGDEALERPLIDMNNTAVAVNELLQRVYAGEETPEKVKRIIDVIAAKIDVDELKDLNERLVNIEQAAKKQRG